MGKKKRLIIPVFIPFGGCPHRCVFCNQTAVTGSAIMPSAAEVRDTVERHLATWTGAGRREIAFYGGSFTGLSQESQKGYLEEGYRFVRQGRVDALRVSTRPDRVNPDIISLLKKYGVDTVELGAQSMSEEVLALSARGHCPGDTVRAIAMLKAGGLKAGVQLMPGLPGDTEETVVESARRVAVLRPDFVRVYPTVVIRDTPLHRMYIDGRYSPWGLSRMVEVCRAVCGVFDEAGIPVIRVGLHPSRELRANLVDGPFHPSFRDLLAQKGA